MRYLVIDRSTSQPSLAVLEEGRPVFQHAWDGEPTRAPEWMGDVERILAERSIVAESLSGFACGLGPGSFSGIRACLAALSGLALPGAKPVYGVASAAAMALGQAERSEQITVVGDARRNRLWCVTYRVEPDAHRVRLQDGKALTHTGDDFLLVPADALAAAVPPDALIVSADWHRLEPVLRSAFPEHRLVARPVYPMAADVGALIWADPETRVLEPLPIYLHPAVAEKAG